LDELGSGLDEDTGQTGLNESLSDTDFNLDDMDLGGSEGSEDTKADFVDLDFSEEDFVANEGSVGEDTITDGTAETGINEALEVEDIGEAESDEDDEFDINDALAATAETPKPDFGSAHSGSDEDDDNSDMDIDFDASLLDATGQTQVLSEDMSAKKDEASISDDDATLLAGGLDTARFAELADDDDLDVTVQTPVADDESTVLGGDLDDFDFAETEALPKGVLDEDESIDFGDAAAGADVDLDLGDLTAALQVSGMENESGAEDGTVEHSFVDDDDEVDLSDQTLDFDIGNVFSDNDAPTVAMSPEDRGPALDEARTMTEVGTKLDLARAYVDMGDPAGARSILEEVLEEGDESQQQQARKLLEALPR
jgi:pilus assembly protein FimV